LSGEYLDGGARRSNEFGMSLSQTALSKRSELVGVATAMLDGRLHLIEGVRKICALRHVVGDAENEAFTVMSKSKFLEQKRI
jgi:hypothetical protein